jgi:hypothetical protein
MRNHLEPFSAMKPIFLAMILAAPAAALLAQSTPKPATTAKTATPSTTGAKLPPGVPPARGVVKTAFSLRYEDIKIGTGAEAEPNKMYKVLYTGWLAADVGQERKARVGRRREAEAWRPAADEFSSGVRPIDSRI